MPFDQFLIDWKNCLPEEIDANVDFMKGLFLVDGATAPSIKYFPKSILSFDPKQRFQDLFLVKSKWEKSEILPYSILNLHS
jgi:sister chromatid cohesion protein DCC1